MYTVHNIFHKYMHVCDIICTVVHIEDMENMVQLLEMGLWEGKASVLLLLPFHVETLVWVDRLLTLEQVEKWLGKLNSTSLSLEPNSVARSIYW